MTLVFIHINKTAGTSVARTAGDAARDAGHRTAADWVATYGSRMSMFAVVRHPYERVRSEYRYRRGRWAGGEAHPHLSNLDRSLEDWVVATFEDEQFRTRAFFDRTGHPFAEHNMADDQLIWFLPQTGWVCDAAGELLVDDILRFERLEDDWSVFAERHALPTTLRHDNVSIDPTGVDDELTARAREVIFDHHRDDFERFGYEP